MLAQFCCIKLQEAELRNTARAGVQSCKDVPHLVLRRHGGEGLQRLVRGSRAKVGKDSGS